MIKTRFTELSASNTRSCRAECSGSAGELVPPSPMPARSADHRLDAAHAEDLPRNRALPRADRQAVRRQPDHPASIKPALRGIRQRSSRAHQDRRDRGNKPQEHVTEFKKHGVVVLTMHQRPPRAVGRAHGRRRDLDRRFRVRGHPARTTPPPDPDPGRRDKVKIPMIAPAVSPTAAAVAALALAPKASTWATLHVHQESRSISWSRNASSPTTNARPS